MLQSKTYSLTATLYPSSNGGNNRDYFNCQMAVGATGTVELGNGAGLWAIEGGGELILPTTADLNTVIEVVSTGDFVIITDSFTDTPVNISPPPLGTIDVASGTDTTPAVITISGEFPKGYILDVSVTSEVSGTPFWAPLEVLYPATAEELGRDWARRISGINMVNAEAMGGVINVLADAGATTVAIADIKVTDPQADPAIVTITTASGTDLVPAVLTCAGSFLANHELTIEWSSTTEAIPDTTIRFSDYNDPTGAADTIAILLAGNIQLTATNVGVTVEVLAAGALTDITIESVSMAWVR